MEIVLEKAIDSDADSIFDMQVKSFTPLLEKYKDYDTSPANETINRVITRINNPSGEFYKILVDNILVGAICICWKVETSQFWISPMFILPDFQGKGIAQRAIKMVEKMFPQAASWELATILEEERNCYLYEKMGYSVTGIRKKMNDQTTLVLYLKITGHLNQI
ncbi:GNAT family N-acetyltransferase [Bacillus sp. V2I10]|uniref:GNAT family N-acetyltransferase n=1 Tax=Bacillus sp. V2I10 TaxID=3042276 RepID=UPI00278A7BD3|nr:GNAT family N-acetyltransferase [Bacillus sp. V2I10]MDQ0859080.1 GNAT superfamily N-acetyltransferase [Bacillus sp. V2I10]